MKVPEFRTLLLLLPFVPLAAATPPACLLACVNLQAGLCYGKQSDFPCLCDSRIPVLTCLVNRCPFGNYLEARDHYLGTCIERIPILGEDPNYNRDLKKKPHSPDKKHKPSTNSSAAEKNTNYSKGSQLYGNRWEQDYDDYDFQDKEFKKDSQKETDYFQDEEKARESDSEELRALIKMKERIREMMEQRRRKSLDTARYENNTDETLPLKGVHLPPSRLGGRPKPSSHINFADNEEDNEVDDESFYSPDSDDFIDYEDADRVSLHLEFATPDQIYAVDPQQPSLWQEKVKAPSTGGGSGGGAKQTQMERLESLIGNQSPKPQEPVEQQEKPYEDPSMVFSGLASKKKSGKGKSKGKNRKAKAAKARKAKARSKKMAAKGYSEGDSKGKKKLRLSSNFLRTPGV